MGLSSPGQSQATQADEETAENGFARRTDANETAPPPRHGLSGEKAKKEQR